MLIQFVRHILKIRCGQILQYDYGEMSFGVDTPLLRKFIR